MSKSQKFSNLFKHHRQRWLFTLVLIFAVLGFVLAGSNYYNQGVQSLARATNNIIVLPTINHSSFVLGLDLQGGTQLVYEADVSSVPEADRLSSLEGVRDIIERRVNSAGVSEPVVQINRTINGDYRIIAELAGIKDVNEAIRMIGETPLLEFKEQSDEIQESDISPNTEAIAFNKQVMEKAQSALKETASVDWQILADKYQADLTTEDNITADGQPELFVALKDLNTGEIVNKPIQTSDAIVIAKILNKSEQANPFKDQEGQPATITSYQTQLLSFVAQDESPVLNIGDNWKSTELSGKNLKRATLQFNPQDSTPEVSLEFDNEGSSMFADITERNIGKPVAIFLDGYAISVPTVNERIPDGRAVISGQFNVQEAKLLVQRLNTGALPVPINLVSQQTVGASLGQKSINNSITAGLLGFLLVAIFMILFYRLPGVMSVLSLGVYALTVLTIFKTSPVWLALIFLAILVVLFITVFNYLKIFDGIFSAGLFAVILIFLVYYANQPVTLTLAGIAGFILSVGMAVDANVLIFERMKEELRSGKPLAAALDEGFKRAWPSIRDGNITTILTCFVLMGFGTGLVKGFGATLFIGVSISMFSSIVITYILLKVFNGNWLDRHRWLLGARRINK
ncbi:MAG: protein translocase subunit SecD [Patescibacteria group bacterium]|nr:protein translocase subunit SecD [Patescibacteria group bacterium]